MQSIIRLIIFALAMLAFGGLRAQTIIGQGNATTITYQKGGIGADSMVKIPYRDTTALYAGYTKCGRITIRPQDGQLYVHDCLRWVAVGSVPDSFASKRYVDSIVATIVAGTVDSNLYATVTRLGDSLNIYHRQGGNTFGATSITGTKDARNWYLKTNDSGRIRVDSFGRVKMGEVDVWRTVIDTAAGIIPQVWDTTDKGNQYALELMNTRGNMDIVFNNTDSVGVTTLYFDNDCLEGGTGPRIRTFGRKHAGTWWNGALPLGEGAGNENGGVAFIGPNGWVDLAIGATTNNYSDIYFGSGNGVSMSIAARRGPGAFAKTSASVGIKYAWSVNPPADFSVNGNALVENNLWVNDSLFVEGSEKISGHLGIGVNPDQFNLHVLDTNTQIYYQSSSATGSATVFLDNNNGRGARISSYGTSMSGTLFGGELNRANIAHFGSNGTSGIAIGPTGSNAVPVIIGVPAGIALFVNPATKMFDIYGHTKIRTTSAGSTGDSLLVVANDTVKAIAPITSILSNYLLISDSNIYTPKYRHDTLAANVYSAIAAGSSGTVTSVSATDGTELDFTVTNPTTTPNISAVLIAGSIANSKLANSTISGVALGSNLNTLTISSPLTGTSYNGSAGASIGIQNAFADGTTKGASTYNNDDFSDNGSGVIALDYDNGQQSSATSQGYLSPTDWILFNAKVAATRAINSGWGINGGGDLSADRTLFLDSTEAATRSDIDTLAAGVYSAFSGSGGTVTSVDASVPAGFAISGNPVTTSGTLAITYATGQTANRFLATPDGTTGAMSLRAIVAADIPTLNQNTTGSAASLTTTRTIWGQNFNGTANVSGDLTLGASNLAITGSIATTGSRVTKIWATDGEFTNPPTVGGTALPTATSTTTFTNKRITPRITTTASSATPTPDADASDMFTVTALAAGAVFAAPTGTPTDGQGLLIRIKDNGTARSLGWNAIYRGGTDIALPTTTVISKTMYVQFIYNNADTKWDLVGLTDGL